MMSKIDYAAACVLVPLAWGLIVYRFSSLLEKAVALLRSGKPPKPSSDVFPDYHI
jgi:hypothetical protein